MMHDKQTAAIARYKAMAGQMKKLPPKAERRAKADQKRYAAEYVTKRRGRAVCDPLRMVRFLVDVCGLNLKEASCAVRAAIRVGGCGRLPRRGTAEHMAVELYRQTGDMVDAVAMARFFGWASDEPQVWEVVRVTLTGMPVVAEATGIENWLPEETQESGRITGG